MKNSALIQAKKAVAPLSPSKKLAASLQNITVGGSKKRSASDKSSSEFAEEHLSPTKRHRKQSTKPAKLAKKSLTFSLTSPNTPTTVKKYHDISGLSGLKRYDSLILIGHPFTDYVEYRVSALKEARKKSARSDHPDNKVFSSYMNLDHVFRRTELSLKRPKLLPLKLIIDAHGSAHQKVFIPEGPNKKYEEAGMRVGPSCFANFLYNSFSDEQKELFKKSSTPLHIDLIVCQPMYIHTDPDFGRGFAVKLARALSFKYDLNVVILARTKNVTIDRKGEIKIKQYKKQYTKELAGYEYKLKANSEKIDVFVRNTSVDKKEDIDRGYRFVKSIAHVKPEPELKTIGSKRKLF